MPYYPGNSDLPGNIRRLPPDVQTLYRESFNRAYEQFAHPLSRDSLTTRFEAAKRLAWLEVKDRYRLTPQGEWVPKEPQVDIVFGK